MINVFKIINILLYKPDFKVSLLSLALCQTHAYINHKHRKREKCEIISAYVSSFSDDMWHLLCFVMYSLHIVIQFERNILYHIIRQCSCESCGIDLKLNPSFSCIHCSKKRDRIKWLCQVQLQDKYLKHSSTSLCIGTNNRNCCTNQIQCTLLRN